MSLSIFAARRIWLVAAVALSLVGCGSVPSLFEGPGADKNLAARSAKVDATAARDLISAYRRKNGQSAVSIDAALQKAAEEQAFAMARADTMSHDLRGTLQARLNGRLDHGAAVENISAGYKTLGEALAGWRDSPAHDRNLLDPAMRRMGIAAAYSPTSKYQVFWSLIMTD
jgi:uncharacterized protein YkwD